MIRTIRLEIDLKLRGILEPPHLDPEVVAQLIHLVERIQEAAEFASDPITLVDEFNERTGQRYGVQSFMGCCGEFDCKQFVRGALMPPPYVPDMTRDELVEIVRRATPGNEGWHLGTEFWYGRLFERHVPMPGAWMLVYHPPDGFPKNEEWDPTPEEVVDLALSYQPIITPLRQR